MIYIDFTTIVTTAMYAFHTKDNKQQWLSWIVFDIQQAVQILERIELLMLKMFWCSHVLSEQLEARLACLVPKNKHPNALYSRQCTTTKNTSTPPPPSWLKNILDAHSWEWL